ncbi:hypothetical protein HII31_06499 [Pseudocercospora fuligena]|uniref:Uncharacterized protein n=1 Tax=Pseudocercospora fuligena TaxID=685502 RepID=A0A8H6RJQ2_9PEZI|nr:hypothetical protein HII31_06499 [Pseudocercospora fuligena]
MMFRILTCSTEPIYIARSIQLILSISTITLSMLIINTFLSLDIARCGPDKQSCTTSISERIPLMVAVTSGILSFFAWIFGCLYEFSKELPVIIVVVFDLLAFVGFLIAGFITIPNRIDYGGRERCGMLDQYSGGSDVCGIWTVDIVLCFIAAILQMALMTWIVLGIRRRPRARAVPVQQGIPLQTLTASGRAVRGTSDR